MSKTSDQIVATSEPHAVHGTVLTVESVEVLEAGEVPEAGEVLEEYQQLKHECARYAASYPTLDEATRDEFLAPQRGHYARVILDGLAANPHIEVPARYRDELDELLANGW